MKVTLLVTEWFKRYTQGQSEIGLYLDEGAAAVAAASAAGIPPEEVGIITVNNVRVDLQHPLQDGDRVKIYTMIIGG